MLTYLAIAGRYRPDWLVWENVPGVLSSNGGRDFGSFLGGLGQLGYGFAYRVLDAQFCRTRRFPWAVPQRRKRVFVVGYFGDWRRAAAVLFDGESLRGNPAPRRQAGEAVTASLTASAEGCSGKDMPEGRLIASEHPYSGTVSAKWSKGSGGPSGDEVQNLVAHSIAPSVTSNPYGDHEARDGLLVAHTLRGEGFDASEDGSGRGTPLVPVAFDCKGTEVQNDDSGVSPPLRSMGHNHSHQNAGGHAAVAFDTTQITSPRNYSHPKLGDPCHPLAAGAHPPALAFDMRGREGGSQLEGPHDTANIRAADDGSSRSYIAEPWAVRRLTPTECARLMGFPDDHARIPWRGKPADKCPDGPQYKAYGNSWAVNCGEYVFDRIRMVETLNTESEAAYG